MPIEDKHGDRPPASLLCAQLEELQSLDAYRRSAEVTYETKYHRIKEEFDQLEMTLFERETHVENLTKKMENAEEMFERLLNDKDYVIKEKDRIIRAQEIKLEIPPVVNLSWKRSTNAPVKFEGRGHTAVVEKKAYFYELGLPFNIKKIYQFDTMTESWDTLPDPPVKLWYTIVTITDLLTTVGGLGNKEGKLYTYMSRNRGEKWVEKFPPIGSCCVEPSATSTSKCVVVLTKKKPDKRNNINGFVLDLQALQWSNFQPFHFSPAFYTSAFMFVNDDILYVTGGIDFMGPTHSFCSIPMSQLRSEMWKELKDQPSHGQTAVCLERCILGIGGGTKYLSGERRTRPDKRKDIYKYIPQSNSWVECGEMEVARANSMVAVVGNQMIVVGNDSSEEATSITDIATAADVY